MNDLYENCWFGVYRGQVTNDNDPEGLKRVKAIVPLVFGDAIAETDWAWPCVSPGWSGVVPSSGDGVWIMFIGGDLEHPVWVGVTT